jgi:hypothetical protein
MSGFEDAQVPILLAPTQRIADHAMDPSDPRLSAFGRMSADAGDIGHFIGTVPNIEPGNYVAVAYCRECIPGGSMFTVGEFRVEGSPLPRTGRRSSVWLLLGMLLVVLGSAAVVGNMAPRGTPATPDSSYSRLIKAKTRETNEARVGDDPVVGGGDDRMQRQ